MAIDEKISELTDKPTPSGGDEVAVNSGGTSFKETLTNIFAQVFNLNSLIAGTEETQTLTNKTIDVDNNTLSNIETDNFKTNVIDTDGTLAADSDTRIPTQKAVKTYVDAESTNINGITLENDLDANDELIFYDNTAGANRKRNAQSSTTVKGLIETATEAEAITGTDTARAVTPNGVSKNVGDGVKTAISRSFGTIYQAATAGILVARATGVNYSIGISSDSGAIPSVSVGSASGTGNAATVTVPILKDDYYIVNNSQGGLSVNFYPIGT